MNLANKEGILNALEYIHKEVNQTYEGLEPDILVKRPDPETWSAADHLRHLIKCVRPLSTALALPKLALKARFGMTKQDARSFDEVVSLYKDRLARRQKAGDYAPNLKTLPDSLEYKQELIENWQEVSGKLMRILASWNEKALDNHSLPHPALGKLSIREMLYWDIYHNWHHLSNVQTRLGLDISTKPSS